MNDSLPELPAMCGKLLSAPPAFILLNVYATVLTQGRIENEAEELRRHLTEILRKSQVRVTAGELAIRGRREAKHFRLGFRPRRCKGARLKPGTTMAKLRL